MYSFDVFETHVAGRRSGFVNQTFFKGDQNLVVIHLKVIAFFLNGVIRLTSMFQLASIDFTMPLHHIWSWTVSIYDKLREIVFNIFLPSKFGAPQVIFRGLSYSSLACLTSVSTGSLMRCLYSLMPETNCYSVATVNVLNFFLTKCAMTKSLVLEMSTR